MVGRYPGLVVSLCARGNSWAVGTNDADLVGRIDLLSTLRGSLCALTTLTTALLLGEEGGEPGIVDEVDSATEDT